jgi:hypothetical protein
MLARVIHMNAVCFPRMGRPQEKRNAHNACVISAFPGGNIIGTVVGHISIRGMKSQMNIGFGVRTLTARTVAPLLENTLGVTLLPSEIAS